MSSVHFRRMNVLVKAASQAEIPKLFLLFLCGHRFGSLSNQPRHITFQNSFMGLSGLFQTSLSINRFRNSSSTRVVKVYRKKLNYNYPVQSRMKNNSCQRKPTKHKHWYFRYIKKTNCSSDIMVQVRDFVSKENEKYAFFFFLNVLTKKP